MAPWGAEDDERELFIRAGKPIFPQHGHLVGIQPFGPPLLVCELHSSQSVVGSLLGQVGEVSDHMMVNDAPLKIHPLHKVGVVCFVPGIQDSAVRGGLGANRDHHGAVRKRVVFRRRLEPPVFLRPIIEKRSRSGRGEEEGGQVETEGAVTPKAMPRAPPLVHPSVELLFVW